LVSPGFFKTAFQQDETTTPQRRTSEGEPFRVSFRFSPPPAISIKWILIYFY
jgi:hypothetical protein